MTKGLFALLMAGSLMVPLITPALGSESTVGLGGARQPVRPRASWEITAPAGRISTRCHGSIPGPR
jgi:hypothetical protein